MKLKNSNCKIYFIVQLCLLLLMNYGLTASDNWKHNNKKIVQMFRDKQQDQCIQFGEEKIALIRKEYPDKSYHPAVSNFITSLAMIYFRTGDHDTALKFLEETIKYRELKFDVKDPRIADLSKIVANIHSAAGRYHESAYYLKRMLEVRKTNFGENSVKVTDAMVRLADVYKMMKKFSEAEDLLKKALNINIKVAGKKSLETGYTYNSLGDLYLAKNNLQKAEENFKKALTIFKGLDKAGEKAEVIVLDNLGYIYKTKNDLAVAESYFRTSYNKRKQISNGRHEIAVSMNNLASILIQRGKTGAAELLTNAIKIIEDHSGKKSPALIPIYENLSALAKKSGDTEGAERFQQMIKRISR